MSSPKPRVVPILPTPPPEMSSLGPNGPLSSELYYRILHNYGNQLMELGETQYALQLPSDPRARATLQRRAHYFAHGRPSRAKKRKKDDAVSRVSDQRPQKRSLQSLSTTSSQNDEPMPKDELRFTGKLSSYSVVSTEENEELSGQFDDADEEEENTTDDVDIFLHFVNHAQKCD